MKALCVKEPHVGRIERGEKTLEIRSRRTSHRGPLVICASKRPAPKGAAVGCTRCLVQVVGCRPFMPEDAAAACIAWIPGMFAWELSEGRSVRRVAVRGELGLFDLERAIEAAGRDMVSRADHAA